MKPAAVLFDFGGTLDACGVSWKERFSALFEAEGVSPGDARFDRAFYDADDALVGAVPRTLGLSGTVSRVARGVAANLGAPEDAAERVAARFLVDARACLAESAAVLARLAARRPLGVVSNFYGNLDAVLEECGLAPHLAVAVDSEVVKAAKPDAAIFRAALDALGVSEEDALFVGDSPRRDMAGAKALGMPHVLLASVAGPLCCPGDRAIARLAALEELLA